MPQPDDAFYRDHIEALLTQLVERGWISEFGFHESGRYALKWTAKGRERAAWMQLIADDLEWGPQSMMALIVICRLHGPA